jgi:hypothetical protein
VPRVLLQMAPLVDFGLAAVAVLSVAVIVGAARLGLRRLATWEAS